MSRLLSSCPAIVWLYAVVIQFAISAPVRAEDADGIVFHDDYNKAIREAKLTKKPIFLEFRCAP